MSSISRYPDLSSRVAKAGDTMLAPLRFEDASVFADYFAAQGIFKLINRLGYLEASSPGGSNIFVNCETFESAPYNFRYIMDGDAAAIILTQTGFELWFAPFGAAGTAITFNPVASFNASGKMLSGIVPFGRMMRTRVSGKNAGVIAILSTPTTLVDVDLGTVSAGDLVQAEGLLIATKLATAGRTYINISKASGTATVSALHDRPELAEALDHAASTEHYRSIEGSFRVDVGGTLILRFAASSAGSNADVLINGAQLTATVLVGS